MSEPPETQPVLDAHLESAPVIEPNAGLLVKAWIDAYTAAHRGLAPHPHIIRRVSGLCRNIGKDCRTLDDWRRAWSAAALAGARGRYNIADLLADSNPAPVSTVRSARDLVADLPVDGGRRSLPGAP